MHQMQMDSIISGIGKDFIMNDFIILPGMYQVSFVDVDRSIDTPSIVTINIYP